MNTVTISLDIEGKKVTITGPEDFVRSESERMANILSSKNQETKVLESQPTTAEDEEKMSERSLFDAKRPSGQLETVAVFAFALKYQHQLDEFSEEDMKRAFIRARVKPPKSVGQALRDAKNKLEYIEYGSQRGSYKLSHHGERTVRFDLPREGRQE